MSGLILKDFVPNFKIIHHTGQIYPTVLCSRTWGLSKCLKMAVTEKTPLNSSANIHY